MIESTVLEYGIYDNICVRYLFLYKVIYGFHGSLVLSLLQQQGLVLGERSGMGRQDLVHLYDLVHGVSGTAFIVPGLERS